MKSTNHIKIICISRFETKQFFLVATVTLMSGKQNFNILSRHRSPSGAGHPFAIFTLAFSSTDIKVMIF